VELLVGDVELLVGDEERLVGGAELLVHVGQRVAAGPGLGIQLGPRGPELGPEHVPLVAHGGQLRAIVDGHRHQSPAADPGVQRDQGEPERAPFPDTPPLDLLDPRDGPGAPDRRDLLAQAGDLLADLEVPEGPAHRGVAVQLEHTRRDVVAGHDDVVRIEHQRAQREGVERTRELSNGLSLRVTVGSGNGVHRHHPVEA
jgi:hypothetical protein